MLKYLYVSPNDFLVLLLGRSVSRVAVGAMGALVTIVVGVLLLGVEVEFGAIAWPLLRARDGRSGSPRSSRSA